MKEKIDFNFLHKNKKKKIPYYKLISLKKLGYIAGLFAVIVVAVIIINSMNKVCFDKPLLDKCIFVELAITDAEKANGLMFRKSLNNFQGMLFLNKEISKRCIWMKNMVIPIDIIWLDIDNKILAIEKHAPPCKEDPCEIYCHMPAKNVIEVKAGFADKYNLKTGNKVKVLIK